MGFLLAGVGHKDPLKRAGPNFLIVDNKTTLKNVEEAFRDFTSRPDIAVLLITQTVAAMIRHLVDGFTKPFPAILEIPSKDVQYNPDQDSILSRVKFLFGGDDV